MDNCANEECRSFSLEEDNHCEIYVKMEFCGDYFSLKSNKEPVAEVPCSAGLSDFVSLADELEREGAFLDNPHDCETDRASGQAYKYCVERIRETIEKTKGR